MIVTKLGFDGGRLHGKTMLITDGRERELGAKEG